MRPRIAFVDPGELSFPAQKSSGTLMRFAPQKPALRYLRLLLLIFCPAMVAAATAHREIRAIRVTCICSPDTSG